MRVFNMDSKTRHNSIGLAGLFLAGLFLSATICAGETEPSDDTIVYYAGKKRVHVESCRRMPTDPDERAKMTTMTYAQAKKKGLPLCSKCPGSTTDANAKNQGKDEDKAAGDNSKPSGETIVYYGGKKRVHVKECRRMPSDPDEVAKMEKMTLAEAQKKGLRLCSKCPGSTTDQDEAEAGGDDAKLPGDTIVFHNEGKKRVHVEGCRRLTKDPEERAKMTKMTLAEAQKKGLRLCSRCPGSTTPGKGNPDPDDNASSLPESWVNPPPDRDAPIEKQAFEPSDRAPLVSLGPDGRLVYQPYTDKGDRILDWSYCGYKQSTQPIPDVAVMVTLTPAVGEAVSDGNMAYPKGPDSGDLIQAALDKVATMKPGADRFRGAVLLKKGTYYIEGGLVVPPGVVLRGEGDGPDGTVIIARSANGGGNMMEVGDADATIEHVGADDASRIADAYVPSGSSQLKLKDASQFKAGDFVCVKKTVNEKWIEVLGCGERLRHIRGGKEGAKKKPWKPESYQFRHIRQVTAVSGNTITLDVMLPQSFAAEYGGGEVYKVNMDQIGSHCGVESLRLVSNYDTTVTDENKSSNFINFDSGIRVAGVRDAWVRHCTVLHVRFACVKVGDHTRQITVRDCKSLKPVGPVRGGNRYAFSIGGGTGHLVYNCYSEDGRHDFAGGSRNMGPIAFVKCTAVRGGQSEPHHRWGCGFLFDNVTTEDGSIAAINRGDSGSGHGWAAANTVIWNSSARGIVVFDPETEGENNFAIGYKGPHLDNHETANLYYANTRSGYWGTPHEGAYYGFALMGSGHIESPDRPVKPDSLFAQQLIDRIGREKAMAVLE